MMMRWDDVLGMSVGILVNITRGVMANGCIRMRSGFTFMLCLAKLII
jgi:hypothetical protein